MTYLKMFPLKQKTKFSLTAFFLLMLFFVKQAECGQIINQYLPENLKIDYEFRYRLESRNNFDFNSAIDDRDTFHLIRSRLSIDWSVQDNLRFFTQMQDARVYDLRAANKSPYYDIFDFRQAYLEIKPGGLFGDNIGMSFGRQELAYGKQRLVGNFNWSNLAQSFDVFKLMLELREYNFKTDAFWGEKVLARRDTLNKFFDQDSDDTLSGIYSTWKGLDKRSVEGYLLYRKTDKSVTFNGFSDRVEEYTIGARIEKSKGRELDYEFEGAYQFGDFGSMDVSAYMVVIGLGYTFDYSLSPRAGFEFAHASGDDRDTRTKRETFDNLHPTNHIHYGYMDRISLQNINDYRFQLGVKHGNKLSVETEFHLFYLDTSEDSLYAADRSVLRAASPGADAHIGNEIDFLTDYKVNNYISLLAGYSHFFAGDFLNAARAGNDGDFFYIQTTLNF